MSQLSHREQRHTALFGPIALIAIGLFFLVNRLNPVTELYWLDLLRLRPLLLIFLGLNVLVLQAPRPYASLLSTGVALIATLSFSFVLLNGLGGTPFSGRLAMGDWQTEPIQFSANGVETAVYDIVIGPPDRWNHRLSGRLPVRHAPLWRPGNRQAGESKIIESRPVETIVLIDNLHAASIRAINFAISLGMPWTALHVSIDEARTIDLQRKWQTRMGERPLVILSSPYRSLTEPVLDYIGKLRQDNPGVYIHIVLGSLITEAFWEQSLHHNSTLVFNMVLRQIEGVAVTIVPFHLHHLSGMLSEE